MFCLIIILLFKTTNEITVYLMLKHTQTFQDRFYFIEIIDFSRLGRALKILVSVVRFRPGPPYIHRSRKTAVFSFVLVQTFALCVRKNNLRSPHFSNTLPHFA